ncbi:hypothetical protein EHQ50_01750 [Leptospira meyeri]|nr:hypothetical protein EHQ50_01750 [Leptospira meyeri]
MFGPLGKKLTVKQDSILSTYCICPIWVAIQIIPLLGLFPCLRKELIDVCLGASNPLVDKCFYLETTALFATIFPLERISAAIAGAGDWLVS